MITNRTSGSTYEVSELNRVESAVQDLANRLNTVGINFSVETKATWLVADEATQSDMTRYISNIATIRAALAALSTTPEPPPDMDRLTYTEANDMEQILLDVEWLLDRMPFAYRDAGTFHAGQGGLI